MKEASKNKSGVSMTIKFTLTPDVAIKAIAVLAFLMLYSLGK